MFDIKPKRDPADSWLQTDTLFQKHSVYFKSFNPNIYFWFFLTFCLLFVCSLSVLENSRVQRQFQTSWVLEDPATTYSLITATWDPVEWWTSKHDSKFVIIKATLTQTVMCLFFHLEAPDFTTNTPLTVSFRQTSAHIHIHKNVYGSSSLKASLTRGKMTACMSVGTKVPAVEQRHYPQNGNRRADTLFFHSSHHHQLS